MGKAVSLFESYREVLADIYSEECLNVIHEIYGASISCALLWNEDDDKFIGWDLNETVDEKKIDDTLP